MADQEKALTVLYS